MERVNFYLSDLYVGQGNLRTKHLPLSSYESLSSGAPGAIRPPIPQLRMTDKPQLPLGLVFFGAFVCTKLKLFFSCQSVLCEFDY